MSRTGSWKERLGRKDFAGDALVGGATRARLARVLLALSIAAIAFCALFPFDFNASGSDVVARRFDTSIGQYFTAGDTIQNLLFFMPLGFALGATLLRRPQQRLIMGLIAAAVGLVVTVTVEILQCYVLERDPSIVDVVNNTLGTAIGYAIYAFVGARLFDVATRRLGELTARQGKWLPGALTAIVVLAACLMPLVLGADAGSLSRWSPTFTLAMGNEINADRVWTGRIWSVAVASRAVNQDQAATLLAGKSSPQDLFAGSLVALYDLRGEPPFHDRSGHNASLDVFRRATTQAGRPVAPTTSATQPQRKHTFPRSASEAAAAASNGAHAPPTTNLAQLPPIDESAEPWPLSHESWLRATGPVEVLSRAVAQANAFTVVMRVSTDRPDQYGQARLLTVSNGLHQQNLMVGQDGTNLVVRVRTRATGDNACAPEFVVPDVFLDHTPRTLVITYDNAKLRVFVNNLNWRSAAPISPEAAVVWAMYPRDYWRFQMAGDDVSRVALVYRAFAFLPIGMLAATTVNQLPRRRSERLMIALTIAGAAVIAMEALMTTAGGQRLSFGNVLISATSAAIGLLVVRLRPDSNWSRPTTILR